MYSIKIQNICNTLSFFLVEINNCHYTYLKLNLKYFRCLSIKLIISMKAKKTVK